MSTGTTRLTMGNAKVLEADGPSTEDKLVQSFNVQA